MPNAAFRHLPWSRAESPQRTLCLELYFFLLKILRKSVRKSNIKEQGFFYWLTVLGGVKLLQEFVVWLLWTLATKFEMGQEVYYLWLLTVIITVVIGSIWLVAAFAFSIMNLGRLPTHILEE